MVFLHRCLTATWIFGLNQAGRVKHFGSESVFHFASPFFVSTAVLTLDCESGPSLAAALTQTKTHHTHKASCPHVDGILPLVLAVEPIILGG